MELPAYPHPPILCLEIGQVLLKEGMKGFHLAKWKMGSTALMLFFIAVPPEAR